MLKNNLDYNHIIVLPHWDKNIACAEISILSVTYRPEKTLWNAGYLNYLNGYSELQLKTLIALWIRNSHNFSAILTRWDFQIHFIIASCVDLRHCQHDKRGHNYTPKNSCIAQYLENHLKKLELILCKIHIRTFHDSPYPFKDKSK